MIRREHRPGSGCGSDHIVARRVPDYQRILTFNRDVLVAEDSCDAGIQPVAGYEYAARRQQALAGGDEAPSQDGVEAVALETLSRQRLRTEAQ